MRWLVALAITTSVGVAHAALDQDTILRAIRAHMREVMACYEKTSERAGRAIVTFTIAPGGEVTKAVGSGFPAVHDCLAGVIRKIRFPRSSSSTEVKYPFLVDFAGQ